MLNYLAAGNGGVPTGLGGFLLSAVATTSGFASLTRSRMLLWRKRDRDLAILEESITVREHKQGPLFGVAADEGFIHPEHAENVHDERSLRALQDAGIFISSGAGHFEDIARVRERTQINEIRSLFRRARMAFNTFLTVATGTSAVLLYGAYLALTGHVASGIVVALCGAVPGTFSVGLYRLQSSADKRADKALKNPSNEVEREALIQRTFTSAREIQNEDSREALRVLGTLRGVMPDASPAELASLLAAVRQVQGYEVAGSRESQAAIQPSRPAQQDELPLPHGAGGVSSQTRSLTQHPDTNDLEH